MRLSGDSRAGFQSCQKKNGLREQEKGDSFYEVACKWFDLPEGTKQKSPWSSKFDHHLQTRKDKGGCTECVVWGSGVGGWRMYVCVIN